MKHLFIINPAAGKRRSTAHLIEHIKSLDLPHEILYTQDAGDGRRYTEAAVQTGEPIRIYACGGDGTLNEVVNGAAGHGHVAVTNVPLGTGNDFLKLFGDKYQERFLDLEALACGPQAAMDVIDCNGLLGIDVACAGVDARVAADVHKYKALPLISGIGAYILSLIVNVLFKGITRHTAVDMGDIHYEGETAIICVCNGRHYGGGFMPVGDAMPDDGVLDMLLVGDVGLFTFAKLVGKYAKGLYYKFPQYVTPYHGQSITFSSDDEMVAVVDGEVIRDKTFTIRLSDRKVNFFYPADVDYQVKI